MPTVTDSNDRLGVDMTVDYTASPGFISITTRLSGELGITFDQIDIDTDQIVSAISGGGASELAGTIGIDANRSMTVDYRLANGVNATLENAINQLVEVSGLPPSIILGASGASPGNAVPSGLQSLPQDTVGLWTGFRDPTGLVPFGSGFKIGGSNPASVNRTIRYNPLSLRVPQRARDALSNLPPLQIELIVTPTSGGTQKFLGGDLRATIDIPIEDIIEFKDLKEVKCGEVYPQIEQRINGISTELDALLEERDLLSELSQRPERLMVDGGFFSGIRDSVSNAIGGGITGSRDSSIISGGITGDEDTSVVGGGITGDEDTSVVGGGITGDKDTSIVGGGITGDADSDVFSGGITGDQDTNVIDEGFTRDEDTSLVDAVSGDPANNEIGIERIAPSTFSNVKRPEIAEDQIDSLDLEGSFFNKLETLLTEIRSIESEVGTKVDAGGCAQKYKSNLQSLRELINEALGLQNRVFDCASDFSSIASRVTNLESRAGSVDPKSFRDVKDFLDDAGELQSDISSQVESNECIQEFRSRINGIVDRVQNFDAGINCIQKYSSIDERIEDIRDRAFDLDPSANFRSLPSLSRVNELLEDAREIRNDVNNNVDDPDCFRELKSRIQGALSRLENVKDTVDIDCESEFPQLNREVNSVIETAERLKSVEEAGDLVSERDAEGLQGSIESVRDQVKRLSDLQQCNSVFRTKIEDAQTILNNELDPRPDLSCDDVESQIRIQTEEIRQEAAQFSDKVPREGTLNRARQLISDARELRNRVDDEVRDANPCKSQLVSDLSTALQRVETFSNREPVPVACSEKFPELNKESKDLQRRASDIRGVVGPDEILDFISTANDLEKRIEQSVEAGDRCRNRLLSRIEASVKRVQSAVGGVRSITEGETGDLLPGIDIEDFQGDIGEIEGPELDDIRQRIQEARAQ